MSVYVAVSQIPLHTHEGSPPARAEVAKTVWLCLSGEALEALAGQS